MSPPDRSSVVVIGGTGATGREIVAALEEAAPGTRVAIASRRAGQSAGGRETFRLDVESPDRVSLARLAEFDLAVIALGPFHAIGPAAHLACLKAGTDALDIIDCPRTAKAVLALRGEAVDGGVRLLTGMGLNPGLSTLLLDRLLGVDPPPHVRVRLFAGGDEPAGRAATSMMIEQFRDEVEVLDSGRITSVPAADDGDDSLYRFPGDREAVLALPCTSAEPVLLADRSAPEHLPGRVDYRIHFQGLTRGVARVLRRSSRWRGARVDNMLAQLFLLLHGLARRNPVNRSSSVLSVDAGPHGRISAGGQTTFGLTARFAAAISALLLQGGLRCGPGVHAMSDDVADPEELSRMLTRLGVRIGHG